MLEQASKQSGLKKLAAAGAACGVLGLCVWIYLLHRNSPVGSYGRFVDRDKAYYVQLASACDSLIARSMGGGEKMRADDTNLPPVPHGIPLPALRLRGDDKSLPPIFRELHPNFINVYSNQVSIAIGPGGRASYVIVWSQDEDKRDTWRLEADADGSTRLLLLSNRLASAP